MRKLASLIALILAFTTGCVVRNEKIITESMKIETEEELQHIGVEEESSVADEESVTGNDNDSDEHQKETEVIEQAVYVASDNEKEIKKIEDVALIGKLNEASMLNGLKLYIGESSATIDISNEASINSVLELMDINGDNKKDIIIKEFIGGSGNIQNIYILLRTENKVKMIMDPSFYISQDGFYSEYLGEGNILFEDRNTGFKKEYNVLVPYENDGWKLDEIQGFFGMNGKAWVDPYSSFSIIDIDDDGIYELQADQIICGIAHVDIIGEMSTIYFLDEEGYKPKEVIYYMIDHQNWQKKEIGRGIVK